MSKLAQQKHTPRVGEDCNMLDRIDSSLSVLLDELVIDILLTVANKSIESIVRCRCVCKAWRDLVLHPEFTKLHHSKSASSADCVLLHPSQFVNPRKPPQHSGLLKFLDHDDHGSPSFNLTAFSLDNDFSNLETRLLGSCNGLLCYTNTSRLHVSNPLTREYAALPLPRSSAIESIFGFGFSPKTNEYKVINIFTKSREQNLWTAKVHTFATGKWRDIGIVPYIFPAFQPMNTYLNGTLYWIARLRSSSSLPFSMMDTDYLICSFNLETEQFKSLAPLPQVVYQQQPRRHKSPTLGVFRDRVCIVCDASTGLSLNAEIWVLKGKIHHHRHHHHHHKNEEYYFWTKEVVFMETISSPPERYYMGEYNYLELIKVLEDGEILFQYGFNLIICYNPSGEGSSRCLHVDVLHTVAHVPSFVSLKHVAWGKKWRVINAPYKKSKLEEKEEAAAAKQEIQWKPI